MNFEQLFEKAKKSSFALWLLNFLLQRYIPFNAPHNLRIKELSDWEIKVSIPYRRKNLNHLKGLHACVLATAAEFSSGVLLLYKLGFKKYRIIMKSFEVEFHYQGKSEGIASFSIDSTKFENEIKLPLQEKGEVYTVCEILCHDKEGNLLCTAKTNWQLKTWSQVKTKLD